ncbi:hypothetical protein Lser_V15G40657 [Lactuca serriola]
MVGGEQKIRERCCGFKKSLEVGSKEGKWEDMLGGILRHVQQDHNSLHLGFGGFNKFDGNDFVP